MTGGRQPRTARQHWWAEHGVPGGVAAGVRPLHRQGRGNWASNFSNKSPLHPSHISSITLSQPVESPLPHEEPGITMYTPVGYSLRLRGDKSHVQSHKLKWTCWDWNPVFQTSHHHHFPRGQRQGPKDRQQQGWGQGIRDHPNS